MLSLNSQAADIHGIDGKKRSTKKCITAETNWPEFKPVYQD
jgi:hypothetical protein